MKTIRKLDEKTGMLHVWPAVKQIWVGEPTQRSDKSADLDEVFGRKVKLKEGERDEPRADL